MLILLLMNTVQYSGTVDKQTWLENNHLVPRFKIDRVFGNLENVNIEILGLNNLEDIDIPIKPLGYFTDFNFYLKLSKTKSVLDELKTSVNNIKVSKNGKDISTCVISNFMDQLIIIKTEMDRVLTRSKRDLPEHSKATRDATNIMGEFNMGRTSRVYQLYNEVLEKVKACRGYYIFHWLTAVKAICENARDININIVYNNAIDYEKGRIAFLKVAKACLNIDELGTTRGGTKRRDNHLLLPDTDACKRHKKNYDRPLTYDDSQNSNNDNNDNDNESELEDGQEVESELEEGEVDGREVDQDRLEDEIEREIENNRVIDSRVPIIPDQNLLQDLELDLQPSYQTEHFTTTLTSTVYATTVTTELTSTTYLETTTIPTYSFLIITGIETSTYTPTTTGKKITITPTKTATPVFITPTITGETTTLFPTFTETIFTVYPTKTGKTTTYYPTVTGDTITLFPTKIGTTITHSPTKTGTVTTIYPTITGPTYTYIPTTIGNIFTSFPTVHMPPTTTQQTHYLEPVFVTPPEVTVYAKTMTKGSTISYVTTITIPVTTKYESIVTLPSTTIFLSTSTVSVYTHFISTTTTTSTQIVYTYSTVTEHPSLELVNNNIIHSNTAPLRFDNIRKIDIKELLRKLYVEYKDNNIDYKQIEIWANRIESVSYDILNQLRFFFAQKDGVLKYNPFSKCSELNKNDYIIKQNDNLFVAKTEFNNWILYQSSTFCSEYCLKLRTTDYISDSFPPHELYPAFGYDNINSEIVRKDYAIIIEDLCLTDKVNNIQCVYERVARRKTTLLYDTIKRICPEESICSFHTDNDVFYANQMITKINFQTYYISNILKIIDKIENVAQEHNISQYLITGGFFMGNLLIFLMIVLIRVGWKRLKRNKKKIKALKTNYDDEIALDNINETKSLFNLNDQANSVRQTNQILLDMENIQSSNL